MAGLLQTLCPGDTWRPDTLPQGPVGWQVRELPGATPSPLVPAPSALVPASEAASGISVQAASGIASEAPLLAVHPGRWLLPPRCREFESQDSLLLTACAPAETLVVSEPCQPLPGWLSRDASGVPGGAGGAAFMPMVGFGFVLVVCVIIIVLNRWARFRLWRLSRKRNGGNPARELRWMHQWARTRLAQASCWPILDARLGSCRFGPNAPGPAEVRRWALRLLHHGWGRR